MQTAFPGGRGIFEQDLAPCHVAKKVKKVSKKKQFAIQRADFFSRFQSRCYYLEVRGLGHMDGQVSGSSEIINFQNCGRK